MERKLLYQYFFFHLQYIKIEKKFSNFTDTRKQLYHKQIKQQATNCLISSKIAAAELLNLTGKYQDCDRKINPLSSDAIFALNWGEKKKSGIENIPDNSITRNCAITESEATKSSLMRNAISDGNHFFIFFQLIIF